MLEAHKFENISEDRFLAECQTGDLILMRCESTIGKLQTLCVGGFWHHAAIVYFGENKDVVFYEAVNTGVR